MTAIQAAELKRETRLLEIKLNDQSTLKFPEVWIRDNCRCDKCLFVKTGNRKTQIQQLDLDINIDTVQVVDCGSNLCITWPDGHKANYPLTWWKDQAFTKENFDKRNQFYKLPAKIWGTEKQGNLYVGDFNEVLSKDVSLYKALVALEEDGVIVLQNTPAVKALDILADGLNTWLEPQMQGESFETRRVFIMKANAKQLEEHNVQAYVKGRLSYHTDQCFVNRAPELLLLHCIDLNHVTGGESIFTDGFKAANVLKEKYPEYYSVLTQVSVYHRDMGKYYFEYHHEGHHPTIKLDKNGDIEAIRYSDYMRISKLNMPVEKVETFYRAYKKFEEILEELHIEYPLKEGDLAIIDNHRVLHGRLSFEITEAGGERFLDGSYMEWDDLLSTRRVLQKKVIGSNGH